MENEYKFTKMHAFGNDFAIFDFREENENLLFSKAQLIIMADRNFGIGCDQIIIINKSFKADDEKGVNVSIRIFNQDGSEAENCGNGIRCVVGYVARENQKPLVRVQVGKKIIPGKPNRSALSATVNMGVPVVNGNIVEIGNKHKIMIVENFDNIEKKTDPEYNLHYVKILSRNEVFMRTIERGSGETLSCGSGSCAVAAYCITNNLVDQKVKIISRGSDIMNKFAEINWAGVGKPMLLTGNYSFVYSGVIKI